MISTERLLPLLRPWVERHSIAALALESGVSGRQVTRILRGTVPFIRFETADALLCAVDRVDAWHGELADLYYGSVA